MADSPSTFRVPPTKKLTLRPAEALRPTEITHFSFDDAHKLRHDYSSLRTYYPPELHTSLSGGYETFVKHDETIDGHLDGMLEAFIELERKTGERVKADVVTWRGMITKFMTLPFDRRNGFEMNAIKFQDTIFIEENHAYGLSNRGPMDERMKKMTFWGYKFEALSTLPTNLADCSREMIENRDSEIVSNEAQFCSIVKTGFGDVGVVIGGEVDAVWNSNPPAPPTPPIYVELKTSRTPQTDRDQLTFERKLLRFWAQSFLLGVSKLIIGFRDDDGVLRSLRELDTQAVPGLARRGLWDAAVCVDFTAALLGWVKDVVGAAEEGAVWRIRWRPDGREVELERTGRESFLLEGFVKWRTEMAA